MYWEKIPKLYCKTYSDLFSPSQLLVAVVFMNLHVHVHVHVHVYVHVHVLFYILLFLNSIIWGRDGTCMN